MATTIRDDRRNHVPGDADQLQHTRQDRHRTDTFRTTARVVGVIYLAGFIVGIGGNILVQSSIGAPDHLAVVSDKAMLLASGALLWLMAVAGDVAHGVLMFPVLKPHGERLAVGYLAARIVDAVFIAVMVVFLLLQIPLGGAYVHAAQSDTASLQALSTVTVQGSQYAYAIGMSALGLAGLILNYTFYRTGLVPRLVAIWGIVGYAIIVCGMLSDIMGSGLGLASSIPGGLWEVFIGVWLIAKGFRSPAIGSRSGTAST
jgi:Domain of unknown function (DUF4386)